MRIDAIGTLARLAGRHRALGLVERQIVAGELHVCGGELDLAHRLAHRNLVRNGRLDHGSAASDIVGLDQQVTEVATKQRQPDLQSGAARQRDGALVIIASVRRVAHRLIGDGDGVQTLDVAIRGVEAFLDRERLQLNLQRCLRLSVCAIQAAQAVVDGGQIFLLSGGLVQQRGAVEFLDRRLVLAPGEEHVGPLVEHDRLEARVPQLFCVRCKLRDTVQRQGSRAFGVVETNQRACRPDPVRFIPGLFGGGRRFLVPDSRRVAIAEDVGAVSEHPFGPRHIVERLHPLERLERLRQQSARLVVSGSGMSDGAETGNAPRLPEFVVALAGKVNHRVELRVGVVPRARTVKLLTVSQQRCEFLRGEILTAEPGHG